MKNRKRCKQCIIIILAFLLAIVIIIIFLNKSSDKQGIHGSSINSIDESSSSYLVQSVANQDLESIIGIDYSKDALEIIDIRTKIGNTQNDEYAPFTEVSVMYTVSADLLINKDCYSLKWDSIINLENMGLGLASKVNHLNEEYGFDKTEIQYINTQFGSCRYDVVDGVCEVDYCFYVFIIKSSKTTYSIYISGSYPYPIEYESCTEDTRCCFL